MDSLLVAQINNNNNVKKPFIEDASKAVCLKGFPHNAERETIYNFVKTLGWVKRFDLPPASRQGKKNKGFCFVHFDKEESASVLLEQGTVQYYNRSLTVEPYRSRKELDRRNTPTVSGYHTQAVTNEQSRVGSPQPASPQSENDGNLRTSRPAPLNLNQQQTNNTVQKSTPPTPHDINAAVNQHFGYLSQYQTQLQSQFNSPAQITPQISQPVNHMATYVRVFQETCQKFGVSSNDEQAARDFQQFLQVIQNQGFPVAV